MLHPGKSEVMLRKWPSIAKQICDFAEKTNGKVIKEAGIITAISSWATGKID